MDLKKTFEQLTDDLLALKMLISGSSPLFSQVSDIPPVLRGNEHLPITYVAPDHLYGHEAIQKAVDIWSDLHIKHDFSQKSARRASGVLWFPSEDDAFTVELVRLLTTINALKESIETHIITTYQTRSARFEALHNQCAGVLTLHLYRQIRWWKDEHIPAVRFSWQEKESLLIPDKTELLVRMGKEGRDDESKEVPLALLMKQIMSVPEERLRIRRRLKVQPSANISFRGEQYPTGKLTMVTAPMPFIIIQNERPEVKMLKIYDANDRINRKPRNDKVKTEILGTFHGESIEVIA